MSEQLFNTTEEPLVSVVIPNYNGERFVVDAVMSACSQTYKNIEIIVVDDCSTDRSKKLVEKIRESDSRIILIEKEENEGVAVARNTGIQNAKGKYIALLDSDDIWEAEKIYRQLIIAESGADIVYCSYDFIDEGGKRLGKPFIVPSTASFKTMLSESVVSCSSVFIKSKLLKEHPFSKNFYHEDYALWMELFQLRVIAKGTDEILMHYRQVKGSRSNNKVHVAKERWRIYRDKLGLDWFTSVVVFAQYMIKGIIKYYL